MLWTFYISLYISVRVFSFLLIFYNLRSELIIHSGIKTHVISIIYYILNTPISVASRKQKLDKNFGIPLLNIKI